MKVKVKVTQSCLTFCDPMDDTVQGILQARILEWIDFPFSRDLPNSGTEPRSLPLQVDSSPAESQGKPSLSRENSKTNLHVPIATVLFEKVSTAFCLLPETLLFLR